MNKFHTVGYYACLKAREPKMSTLQAGAMFVLSFVLVIIGALFFIGLHN